MVHTEKSVAVLMVWSSCEHTTKIVKTGGIWSAPNNKIVSSK